MDYEKDDQEQLVEDNRPITWKDRVSDALTSRPALFTYLTVTCVTIGLLIPMWFLIYYPLDLEMPIYTRGSCMIATKYRFPCLVGEENTTDLTCALAGCCWYDEEGSADQGPAKCFHSMPASYTYKMHNSTVGPNSISADLTAYSFADTEARRAVRTPYNNSALPHVTASVTIAEPERVLLEMGPPPAVALTANSDSHPVSVNGSVLTIASNTGPEWDFFAVVSRTSTGQALVDTRLGATIVSDQYTEFTVVPASTAVYGLGQAFHSTLRRTFDWPPRTAMFGRSRLFSEGSHPFYMCIEPSGDVHGVYLETSAPVEVQLMPGPSITFRVLDSRVKLHVLAGPTPADVTDQYTQLVGRPRLPPLWALGFHLCREGDVGSFDTVMEQMVASRIPFESDCVDATALLPLGFEASEEFLNGSQKLHGMNRHVMAAVAPHLPLYRDPVGEENTAYPPYEDADVQGLLLRNDNNTDNVYGELYDLSRNRTWNVSYVDYSNPATVGWAKPLYQGLITNNSIDGFFLMRNTPTNDGEDMCNDSLPFVPNLGDSKTLSNGTVCMLSKQASGDHLTSHNRYGQEQTRTVREATKDTFPSLMLTSTSTSPGSGLQGGHFATGMTADWTSLSLALVETLELGLYGIPQSGYPICGSRNSTSIPTDDTERLETLCLLWYQLLPYLPLAVSHYEAGHLPRNPTQMSSSFKLSVLAQVSQRYVFIPYHYTLLVEASQTGVPPLRPLWYEFAQDNATWDIDQQLLLGPALMIAPALTEGQQIVELYLPGSCWYEYFQGFRPKDDIGPGWVKLPVPAQQTLIYQRAGSVIFNQQASETLSQQRVDGIYSATVALTCEEGYQASGTLYLPGDDAAIGPGSVTVTVRDNSTVEIVSGLSRPFCDFYYNHNYTSVLKQVQIFGITESVTNVTLALTPAGGAPLPPTVLTDPIHQTLEPPALIVQDVNLDWCRFERAEITWTVAELV
ncbi:Maltase-glucoamylase, intestinal [Amphibalanus amphitrite]|uniref:Maltase-glucoamylase, intestinal n=1 Tax=Amphibalanus amphitrite TaxID=1232801 RepID=A0A6A4X5Y5_AMPAM|nr:Maltase-glucoamylase, intestinal [Amphibalanus amphitrite]